MEQKRQFIHDELNQALDFDKVLEQIASFASFSRSKEEILQSFPLSDLKEIQHRLQLSSEAISLEQKGISIPIAGCSDISSSVKRAEKKAILQGEELLAVSLFLHSCANIEQALSKTECVCLKDYAQTIDSCSALLAFIEKRIDGSGSVKDNASRELVDLSKKLFSSRHSLQERARTFLKKHANQLMENMTTSIQGRLSVLVRAQDKNNFGGMVHGQSQSGQAFYIEPSAFVELNNQIQSLEAEIASEKRRICKECSLQVAKKANALHSNLETMTIIDVALAKGKWAYQKDGCIPFIHKRNHKFHFIFARHPLIDSKKVIANTYSCSKNCLMISGPNMGGKTVTLKTIGLFMVLAHAGFPVLSHEAILPFYTSFYFDIGDQQSIENNLSTFSSHISKIASICHKANEQSFILIDELGNGTDPSEGASLAIAILDYLIDLNCTIITSTHFNQVKNYGKTHDQVLVSSVEFDQETLKPTYKYVEGVSGASYAFSIAAQYHLEESILKQAQEIKEENKKDLDVQLEKLEIMQNDVRQQKERFNQLIQNAHQLQKDALLEKDKISKQKEALLEAYEEQLNDLLEKKQDEAHEIIQALRQNKHAKMHEKTNLYHQLNAMGHQERESAQNEELKVGDYVQIKDINTHGEIVEIRKKEAVILSNGMKMKIKMNRLTKIKKPNVQKEKSQRKHVDKIFARVPTELNIIGYHVEDGIAALDKYIDQCVAHRMKQVRIIHGMGTGKLRTAVWKYLDRHPHVQSKMSGGPSDGGLGATVVTLK